MYHACTLNQHGIISALQLRGVDDQWIRNRMGIVGLRLVMELRGVSCLDLEQCPSVTRSRDRRAVDLRLSRQGLVITRKIEN